MKREYVRPTAVVEQFEANDYVAACYMIYCETPNNNASYNKIYYDSNNNGIKDNADRQVYSNNWGFNGCGRYHKGVVQGTPPVANGFVTDSRGNNSAPVFIWEEKLGGNTVDIHVMNPNGKGYEDISSPNHPNASA